MEKALALQIPISALNSLSTHHISLQHPARYSILHHQGQLSVVRGQGWGTLAAVALCGTQETYLDIFGGLETAGHGHTWQQLRLRCIHGLDLSVPYVLVLTQISPDEVLPLHKGGSQAWTNVYAAQNLAWNSKPTSTALHSHGGPIWAPWDALNGDSIYSCLPGRAPPRRHCAKIPMDVQGRERIESLQRSL